MLKRKNLRGSDPCTVPGVGGALLLDLWGAERDSQELSQNGPKPK